MSKFVTGPDLTQAARRVAGGKDLRCAVAFWGRGALSFMEGAGAQPKRVRIVCDLSMGGCSPDALVEFGCPTNPAVRHRAGLHAKVYISDAGMLVGSANASHNGLGFGDNPPGLLEAASFHKPGTKAWAAACEWFERIHGDAPSVDEAALEVARRAYNPPPRPSPLPPARPGSLLDMIAAQPGSFAALGFVIVSTESTEKQRNHARKSAIKAGISAEIVDATADGDLFPDWEREDLLKWPVTFIELWVTKGRLRYYPRTVTAVVDRSGSVFTKRNLRAVRKLMPADAPDLEKAGAFDDDLARRLLSLGEQVYRDATQLADAIGRVLAEKAQATI